MIIDNYYMVDIKIDGLSIFQSEKLFSFSIKESIYKIYSTGILTIKDLTSIIQESLLILEGSILEIEFGLSDSVSNKCKYVITKELLDKVDRIGNLVGDVELELKHEWFVNQAIKSAAYEDRVDLIVQAIVSKYNFTTNDIDMNSTGNEDVHYQPMINDADFIEQRLTPIAFSNNANKTSFYSFTTSDNVFHFRNGQSMLNENPVEEYTYRKESFSRDNTALSKVILSIKRWKEDLNPYKEDSNSLIMRIDRKTGKLLEEKENIYNYGSHNDEESLPFAFESTTNQSFLDLNYKQTLNGVPETGRQENQSGYINYLHRKSMFVDRFMVVVPFNPKLHAGKVIKLNLYTMKNEEVSLSITYSGKYLIEELEHTWSGDDRKGYTLMKIGRRYVNINSDVYSRVSKFVKKVTN